MKTTHAEGELLRKTVSEIETMHQQDVLTPRDGSVSESLVFELQSKPMVIARKEEAILADRRPQC
jgi:hypothetical protein